MIRLKLLIDDINLYQTGKLPENAIKLKSPSSIEQMMKKSSPIAVFLCLILFVVMFLKTYFSGQRIVSPLFILLGVVIGYAFLLIHEWLHAIVYPKEANVTIGILKNSINWVALVSYPLKRNRFIFMSLLPFLLGIIPLTLFIISPHENIIFNSLMFGTAYMGIVSPFPDVYNIYLILKQTKSKDSIMFYKNDMYCIHNS